MSASDVVRALSQAGLLHGVASEEATLLATQLTERALRPGEVLYRRGASGDALALVVDGELSVHTDGDAKAPPTSRLYSGDMVGEMACIDPAPRSATVVAATASRVVSIDRTLLLALERSLPAAALAVTRAVITTVTRRIRETNERVERLWRQAPTTVGTTAGTEVAPRSGPPPKALDLRALPCFRDYQDWELQALVSAAPPRAFPEGSILCREGARGASCFVLAHGSVDVLRAVDGKERLLGTLGPGALIGQLALVDASPRSATIRAATGVVALELHRDAFDGLVAARSSLAVKFQRQVAVAGVRQLRLADVRLTEAQKVAGPDQGAATTLTAAYMSTALREWGMTIKDLDGITVRHAEGVLTQAEIKARQRFR
jgi:cAMP-dependent protein kinase regulator